MNWFNRNKPPSQVIDQAEAALKRPLRVLAWGSGPAVFALGLADALVVGRADEWSVIEWHLMRSGGWNAETSTLRWERSSGETGEVKLEDAGRLPELFRERVHASIVVEQWVEAPERGKVLIAGRRNPGNKDVSHVVWQAAATGGASLSDPATAALVVAKTKALRADYEL